VVSGGGIPFLLLLWLMHELVIAGRAGMRLDLVVACVVRFPSEPT
jgi:hypothetical protein